MNTPDTKVLFVDDEPQVLETISLIFRNWHFVTAVGAETALKAISDDKFAVVVSDQRMPGMTGAELLKKVREIAPETIRIILTGYSDMDSIIEAINSGEVWRFINKPWDNQKLKATVKAAVDLYEVNRMLKEQQKTGRAVNAKQSNASTVLFIDKRADHLQKYQELFKDTYNVRVCETLPEALKIIESEPIAAVACDSSLASEEGADFLAAIKQRFPAVVTIFMSDSKDANEAIRLINEGQIFRYLVKPFPRQALINAVQEAVQKHSEIKVLPKEMISTAPRVISFSQMLADIRRRREEKKAY